MSETLTHTLHDLRKRNGLSQRALGSLIGVSGNSVCGWENGTRAPGPAHLKALAEALNVTEACLTIGPRKSPVVGRQLADKLIYQSEHDGRRRTRAESVIVSECDGKLRSLEEIEAEVIRLAIVSCKGNLADVARGLGISRSTLYRKLSDLSLDQAA